MLLVKCLHLSGPGDDAGLYTLEPVARGQVLWRYGATGDIALPHATREALSDRERRLEALLRPAAGAEALPLRHAEAPNVDFSAPRVGIALRDIAEGEMLTADHGQFFAACDEAAA